MYDDHLDAMCYLFINRKENEMGYKKISKAEDVIDILVEKVKKIEKERDELRSKVTSRYHLSLPRMERC